MQHRVLTPGFLLLMVIAGGCAGSDAAAQPQPEELLAQARQTLDDTSGVRFSLTGEALPAAGTVVVSAEGVAAHPASFEGDVRLTQSGNAVTVAVVSIDGTLWAQLPLTDGYAEVSTESLGFGDPGRLIDTERGVSVLLTSGSEVSAAGQVRIGDEVFDRITTTLPGSLVGNILTIADPGATVDAEWAIDSASGELRRAVLAGPFYTGGGEQTYTLLLDGYGETYEISAPTG